jgi:hypothetical protein
MLGREGGGVTILSGAMNHSADEQEPPSGGIKLTEQQLRARRARSLAIALALGAFVVVVFLVTLVRLGGPGVISRPL